MQGATKLSILEAAVKAASFVTADIDARDYDGLAQALIAAQAQGSGITLDAVIQSSPDLAVGSTFTTTGDADLVLRNGTDDNVKLAVQFTQSGARQVKQIWLKLKKTGTITSGKVVTLKIVANDAGAPDTATVLGTAASVQTDDIAATYGWIKFTFATPVDLADATVYHLLLEGDYTLSSSNHIKWSCFTVASAGTAEIYDDAWADAATLKPLYYIEQYNFTNLVAFSQIGNAAASEIKAVNMSAAGAYVRGKGTVAGGSATGTAAIFIIGKKQVV